MQIENLIAILWNSYSEDHPLAIVCNSILDELRRVHTSHQKEVALFVLENYERAITKIRAMMEDLTPAPRS